MTLNDIARGDADCAQARVFVAGILGHASPGVLADLHHALRAWTWKALRRRQARDARGPGQRVHRGRREA